MAGKEPLRGPDWYKKKRYVSKVIWHRRYIWDRYERLARHKGWSLQRTVRAILTKHAPK